MQKSRRRGLAFSVFAFPFTLFRPAWHSRCRPGEAPPSSRRATPCRAESRKPSFATSTPSPSSQRLSERQSSFVWAIPSTLLISTHLPQSQLIRSATALSLSARTPRHSPRRATGPNGRNKMVINHLEKLFVTSDAATIIRELEVVHPAGKVLVMASQQQEHEVSNHFPPPSQLPPAHSCPLAVLDGRSHKPRHDARG